MSFVTTVCGGAAGSAAPPEPCPHSGAATTEATATVAHQRAQCVIPTSVEGCGGVLPPPPREPHVHVAPGSPLIITSPHEDATPPGRRGGDCGRTHGMAGGGDVLDTQHAPAPPRPRAR